MRWPVLLAALLSCSADTSLPLAGQRCSGLCDEDLVCVDGLCRVRPEVPRPEDLPLPPTATFDIATADEVDGQSEDTALDPDAGPTVERLMITAFDRDSPADTRLALAVGQAAAAEVTVTVESRPELVRVTVFRPDTSGCGLWRALLWVPRPMSSGQEAVFDITPTAIGELRIGEVDAATTSTVELPLPDPASIPRVSGPVRIGARFEGPCTTSASAPFVLLDTSSELAQTFVWSEAWVPGVDLSLPGRFALELQLLVPPP